MKTIKAPLAGPLRSGSNLSVSIAVLDRLARDTGFISRSLRKLTLDSLIVSLLCCVAFGERSCRAVALAFGVAEDTEVSRQAVWKHLKKAALAPFLEAVIARVIRQSCGTPLIEKLRDAGSEFSIPGVSRILAGDASTFAMHPALAQFFPGSKNQTDTVKAHLKLQLVVDLLTGRWVHFTLDSYRRGDAKAAMDFVPLLQAGDLLIRDLGYATMECFRAIIERKAFFVSRLKAARIHVFDPGGEKIDLLERLRGEAGKEGDVVRFPILMTGSDRVPCALVAVHVPREVADERRRKLRKKHRDQSWSPPSKLYLALQDWTLLVTNLPAESATDAQVRDLYLCRWRIESIFKACKSHTGMLRVARHRTNANQAKGLVLCWVLAMVVLARGGVFAMAELREVRCPRSGGTRTEIEALEASLLKEMEKRMLTFGFYLELRCCGMDYAEHLRRTARYGAVHNWTEQTPGRDSLCEILSRVLHPCSLVA